MEFLIYENREGDGFFFFFGGGAITESVVDMVVEGVPVAVVAVAVVGGGELLEALRGDGGEVAGDLGVVGQHDGAARHEAVDQRRPLLRRHVPPPAPAAAA